MRRPSLKEAYGISIRESCSSLDDIHREIKDVDMTGELPEQKLLFQYVRPGSRVLEFGGNIGRSSLVISKILKGSGIHVVFESDPESAQILTRNRDRNGLQFHVVNAALSEKRIAQKDWNSILLEPNQSIPEGYYEVNTISWDRFRQIFPHTFDTLVVDCEGCIDSILKSYPQILDTIHTVVLENDGGDDTNERIRKTFREKGFRSVHCGIHPSDTSITCFFEVWKRTLGAKVK